MKKKAEQAEEQPRRYVPIDPPKFGIGRFLIRGTAPLVINAFPSKAREEMKAKQERGSQERRKGSAKGPKDFEAAYEAAKHVSTEGWCGIPAAAFRNALITACGLIGFKMTVAKQTLFILEDGADAVDHGGLVKITLGEPKYDERPVRNQTGVVDMRPRPMWARGWEAVVTIRWDEDAFKASDVANLLVRAGIQVGICEGRPYSKRSSGMGWGTFEVVRTAE